MLQILNTTSFLFPVTTFVNIVKYIVFSLVVQMITPTHLAQIRLQEFSHHILLAVSQGMTAHSMSDEPLLLAFSF